MSHKIILTKYQNCIFFVFSFWGLGMLNNNFEVTNNKARKHTGSPITKRQLLTAPK